jgi:hypothetical protein
LTIRRTVRPSLSSLSDRSFDPFYPSLPGPGMSSSGVWHMDDGQLTESDPRFETYRTFLHQACQGRQHNLVHDVVILQLRHDKYLFSSKHDSGAGWLEWSV